MPESRQNAFDITHLENLDRKNMETLRKEIFHQLPKIMSNLIIALLFWSCSQILLVIGNTINSQNLIFFFKKRNLLGPIIMLSYVNEIPPPR